MPNINLKPIKLVSRNNNYKVENHKNNINLKDATYDEINDYFFLDEDDLVENALNDLSTFLYRLFNNNDETLNKSVVKTKENNLIAKNDYGIFVYTRDNVLENYYFLTYRNENDTKYSPEVLDRLSAMGVSLSDIANDEWITKWINYYFHDSSTKIDNIVLLDNGNIEVTTVDGKYEYDGKSVVSFTNINGKTLKKEHLDLLMEKVVSGRSIIVGKDGEICLDDSTWLFVCDIDKLLNGDFGVIYVESKLDGYRLTGSRIGLVKRLLDANSVKLPENIRELRINDSNNLEVLTDDVVYTYIIDEPNMGISLLSFKTNNGIIYDAVSDVGKVNIRGEYYPIEWYNDMVLYGLSSDVIINVKKDDNGLLYVKDKDGLDYYYNQQSKLLSVYSENKRIFESVKLHENDRTMILEVGDSKNDENGQRIAPYEYVSKEYNGKYYTMMLSDKEVLIPLAYIMKNNENLQNSEIIPYSNDIIDNKTMLYNKYGLTLAKRINSYSDKFNNLTINNPESNLYLLDLENNYNYGGITYYYKDVNINVSSLENSANYSALLDTYVHEFGHVYDHFSNTDSNLFKGTESTDWLNVYDIVKQQDSNNAYVSQYATSSPVELFAESTTEYFSDDYSEVYHHKNHLKAIKIDYTAENGNYYRTLYDYMDAIYAD